MKSKSKNKNIIWLASYPKSGNTWFRVFLANLLENKPEPVNINSLNSIPIASSRSIFDRVTGLSSANLRQDEINRLRPAVYEKMAKEAEDTIYFKIHDAFIKNTDNQYLIPPGVSEGIIYLIRNPLDVAVSFSNHSGVSEDKMIGMMNDPKHAFCRKEDRLYNQLTQSLLTWTEHVRSWTEQRCIPLHVIRYEDMCQDPLTAFRGAIDFAGINYDEQKVKKALKFSSFKELQRQEKEKGFVERSSKSSVFFRKGKTGSWRKVMDEKQVERVINDHKEIMIKYGYLDKEGNIL